MQVSMIIVPLLMVGLGALVGYAIKYRQMRDEAFEVPTPQIDALVRIYFVNGVAYWKIGQDFFRSAVDDNGDPDLEGAEKINLDTIDADELPILMEIQNHLSERGQL